MKVRNRLRRSMKGVKLIKHRLGAWIRFKIALAAMQSVMVLSQSMCRINAIRCARTNTPEELLRKKLAIAEACVSSMSAVNDIFKQAKY